MILRASDPKLLHLRVEVAEGKELEEEVEWDEVVVSCRELELGKDIENQIIVTVYANSLRISIMYVYPRYTIVCAVNKVSCMLF